MNMIDSLVTIGIKTFCRPGALNETLFNIIDKSKYTNIKILIADDSSEECKKQNKYLIEIYKKKNKNIKLISLDFDVGISEGRNVLVKNCTTKYFLLLDDSRYFNRETNIEKMVKFLEITNYDMIGGVIQNRQGIDKHYSGLFKKIIKDANNNTYIYVSNVKDKIDNDILLSLHTNIMVNVFICKTSVLIECPWKKELKVNEHEQFFLDIYNKNYKCAISPSSIFFQVLDINRLYPNNMLKEFRLRDKTTIKSNVNVIFTNNSNNLIKKKTLNYTES